MTSADAQTGLGLPLAGPALLRALADNWWLLLLRGIASVAFGCLAFFWPGLTLLTLTFLWGAYAASDGVFALWAAVSGQGGEMAPRWWLAVVGVAGILAGVLAFVWPGMTALVLLMFVASWAIIIGVLRGECGGWAADFRARQRRLCLGDPHQRRIDDRAAHAGAGTAVAMPRRPGTVGARASCREGIALLEYLASAYCPAGPPRSIP
jgi:hypothetical protein